ncbi:MAG TPA: NUDIX domain-containing protein [Micromonosporaceae bacterium]|nr:NUDIX domain-containing protein [Micromonosporaceae bacterium]
MTHRHRTPVDVLILVISDGKVLLTERAGNIYLSGHWAIPGGHVEAEEDVVSAAIREVQEEVGIHVASTDLHFVGVTHHRPPRGDARVGFGFVATRWSGQPTNMEPAKCSQLAWFPPTTLPEPTMEYTQEIVRLYLKQETFSLHGW